MKSLNFSNLSSRKTNSELKYKYADLHLDFRQGRVLSPGFTTPVNSVDIAADYDLGAIHNSLVNLFNTMPGQRPLVPEYGLDLHGALFTIVSTDNGRAIGSRILHAIQKWEDRVQVQSVNVNAVPDDNMYEIRVSFYIPALKQFSNIEGVQGRSGFIYVPTSRNT